MVKSISYYYFICILLRLYLTFLIYKYYLIYNKQLIILYFIFFLGFSYQYISKIRKKGAFNQSIWWDFLRPIHALNFLIISILLFYKYKNTYLLSLFDTFLGIPFHFYYRYN